MFILQVWSAGDVRDAYVPGTDAVGARRPRHGCVLLPRRQKPGLLLVVRQQALLLADVDGHVRPGQRSDQVHKVVQYPSSARKRDQQQGSCYKTQAGVDQCKDSDLTSARCRAQVQLLKDTRRIYIYSLAPRAHYRRWFEKEMDLQYLPKKKKMSSSCSEITCSVANLNQSLNGEYFAQPITPC